MAEGGTGKGLKTPNTLAPISARPTRLLMQKPWRWSRTEVLPRMETEGLGRCPQPSLLDGLKLGTPLI